MKYLVISDIHGSAYYANKAVDAFTTFECDRILILGDILYHGPRNPLPKDYDPKQVISLLNALASKIIACRGNCDSEVDQMVLNFPIMSTTQSIPLGNQTIFLSHGHIYSEESLPENCSPGDIFIYGHTHIPRNIIHNGVLICNPGSVSLPKENHPPTIAILEDGVCTHYEIETYTPYHLDIQK